MQKKKQRVEIIFINLGEETSVTVRKNDGVSGNAVEKENDVSFVFLSELYMIEHQSTVNPNMPLRNLTYISNVLSKITAKEDIYGSKQIKLPTPRFIVLYNGTKQTEEKTVLKLSDAYEKKMVEPELELITTVLNINEGYNEKLKSACKLLRDYMTLITKIREKQKTMDLQQATYQAIAECIREDVLKDFLMKHRAMEPQLMQIAVGDELRLHHEAFAS